MVPRGTDRGLHGFEVEDETKALDEFLPGVLFANANDVVLLDKVAPTAATLADLVPSPRGQFKKPTSVTDDTIAENTRGAAEIARLIGVTNDVAKAQQEMKRTFDSGGPVHLNYLDTLAAAYAEAGNFDAAVKWQTTAIERRQGIKEKNEYSARLKLYREKKPYHETRP